MGGLFRVTSRPFFMLFKIFLTIYSKLYARKKALIIIKSCDNNIIVDQDRAMLESNPSGLTAESRVQLAKVPGAV